MDDSKIFKFGIFAMVLAIILVGVFLFWPEKKEEKIVEQIIVETDSIKLKVSEKQQIKINSNVDVVYKSEDTNVALVDASGYIYAVKAGNTRIEVIYNQRVCAYISVFVYEETTVLSVNNIKIESTNDSKEYVKKGDELLIYIDFNRVLNKRPEIYINEEKLSYTFTTNQSRIIVAKEIKDEQKLEFKIMLDSKVIYTSKMPIIDNESPTCKLELKDKNIVISGNDNNQVSGYAISKTQEYTYTEVTSKQYDSSGKWYGSVVDGAGNVGYCSIDVEKKINPADIIIIGDSRMVGLCSYSWYKSDQGNCVAKSAMGYKWMVETAIPKVNDILKNDKEYYITSNLGVNDLYNVNKYIAKYKELATTTWKNRDIFIISVNPTKGNYDGRNSEINSFNSKVKSELSGYKNIIYCNTIDTLRSEGFGSNDGLHYNQTSSKRIYELIKQCIYNYYN